MRWPRPGNKCRPISLAILADMAHSTLPSGSLNSPDTIINPLLTIFYYSTFLVAAGNSGASWPPYIAEKHFLKKFYVQHNPTVA